MLLHFVIVCRRTGFDSKRFAIRSRIVDDIALWCRFAESKRIGYLDRVVALYRHHDDAPTTDSELSTRETPVFHQENYFRQCHLFDNPENRRYRNMLARFLARMAARPSATRLEKRANLAEASLFDFRLQTLRWLLGTFV